MTAGLKDAIDAAFEQRQDIKPGQTGAVAEAVEQALTLLDRGQARVAGKIDGAWVVNEWLKKGHPALIQAERKPAHGRAGARSLVG